MNGDNLQNHMLRTYKSLRRLIVLVTLAFLISLAGYRLEGSDREARNSISAYYHHDNQGWPMNDIYVGVLCAVGVMLIAYQGYSIWERWALNIAGAALIATAYYPMDWPAVENASFDSISDRAKIHYASAITFFACIAYVCLLRAHDTLHLVASRSRRKRMKYYYNIIGTIMLLIPSIVVLFYFLGINVSIFHIEWFGIAIFMVYWVVKSVELDFANAEKAHVLDVYHAMKVAVGTKI